MYLSHFKHTETLHLAFCRSAECIPELNNQGVVDHPWIFLYSNIVLVQRSETVSLPQVQIQAAHFISCLADIGKSVN